MDKQREQELIELAKSKKDVELALVVGNQESLWDYLERKVDKAKKLPQSKRTVLSRIRANSKRANQLEGWIKHETDESYKRIYEQELDLLNEVGYITLLNLLTEWS